MKDLDLIIAVDEIPDAGHVIEGDLPAEWLGSSALEAYTPLSAVNVSVKAQRFSDNVHVSGQIKVRLGFACSRTLEPGEIDLEVKLGELFQPEGNHALNLGDGVDSEEIVDQPYTYSNRRIDIEPFIREELVLAQSPYPVASLGEQGGDEGEEPEEPAWSSAGDDVDPRWAKLQGLKLNQ